jgi:hypothetical protein
MNGIGRHQRDGVCDPVLKAAKITGLFGLCVAVIGVIPTSINVLSPYKQPPPPPAPTTTSLATVPDSALTLGPFADGKLTVSGAAQKDVFGMWVMIGPKPSGGYDSNCGNVTGGQWQAVVATDASWQKYRLQTVPVYGHCTANAAPLNFTVQGTGTTTPTPPPGQVLDCTRQFGPSCLTGPGFGPPTTYEPSH